jgi:hypothetical protein
MEKLQASPALLAWVMPVFIFIDQYWINLTSRVQD